MNVSIDENAYIFEYVDVLYSLSFFVFIDLSVYAYVHRIYIVLYVHMTLIERTQQYNRHSEFF